MILVKKDPNFDYDELLEDSVKICALYDRASASLLQRRLSIGYARAALLIDQLELIGALGKSTNPGAPRPVFINKNKKLDKAKIYKEGSKENLIFVSDLIKQTLLKHGISVKFKSISNTKTSINVFMEVVDKSKTDKVLEYTNELATALSSPNGKIELGAPFKGTSIIALFLPTKKTLKPASFVVINENYEIIQKQQNSLVKFKITCRGFLFGVSAFFERLAYKL